MNIDKEILKIKENKKVLNLLRSVGAYPYNISKIGPTGKIGPIGPTGPQGLQGERGETGLKGEKGDIGLTGPRGLQGVQGERGLQGEKGEKGDKGEQGPRGLQGIQGEKGDAGKKGDKGEKGEMGPTGPKGDSGGVGVYGERFANDIKTFSTTSNETTVIPLNSLGPALFIRYENENSITIKKGGFYKIDYFFNAIPNVDTTFTLALEHDDIKILGSNIKVDAKQNTKTIFFNTVIASLYEDEDITLTIMTDKDVNFTFDGTTIAKISIIKID